MQKNLKKIELQFCLGLTYIDWNLGAKTPQVSPNLGPIKSISALNWLAEF